MYGEVFQGTLWGQAVALKKLRGNKFRGKRDDFSKEVRIMQSLRHPNIVTFLGACWGKGRCVMVTEFVPNGSLEDMLQRHRELGKKMSLNRILQFSMDIARGLNWLHHKLIIHRDLKTENVLVSSNFTLKIADFGLAHFKTRADVRSTGFYGVCGTPCYMAPEVLRKDMYNYKCDVFSFGMVLCELVLGEYPFEHDSAGAPSDSDAFDEAIVRGLRPPIPDYCAPELKDLIEECWLDDADSRPEVDELMLRMETLQQQQLTLARDILEDADDEVAALFEEQARHLGEAETELKQARRKLRSTEELLLGSRRENAALTRQVAALKKAAQQQALGMHHPQHSRGGHLATSAAGSKALTGKNGGARLAGQLAGAGGAAHHLPNLRAPGYHAPPRKGSDTVAAPGQAGEASPSLHEKRRQSKLGKLQKLKGGKGGGAKSGKSQAKKKEKEKERQRGQMRMDHADMA